MYQPSQLRAYLASLGIGAKKGLSQNFLIDGNIVRKIVSEAKVQLGDLVLEIGPGPGALTEALIQAGAQVIAVEKDHVLAKALQERLPLEVFEEDVLAFPWRKILSERLAQGQKVKIIANLPYHLTTPILTNFAPAHDLISSMTVMVQKEVAERICAPPGGKDYSSLTVFLSYHARISYAFTVSNQCFFPPPKVHSAVITLQLRPSPEVSNQQAFFIMTRTAFGQRRKMLRASLSELYTSDKVTQALLALQKNPLARPEELSLETFLELFEKLSIPAAATQKHNET